MGDLVAHVAALLFYPGLLAAVAIGLAAEVGSAWAFVPERGFRGALRVSLSALRPRIRPMPALAAAAAVLALVAATELAAPFSPVSAPERSALVAAAALVGAGWLTWGWGWGHRALDLSLVLAVQAAWLIAVLLPAVVPETLSPDVLGSQVFPAQLGLKIASGALYLACLPPLLQLIPEAAPQGSPGAAAQSPPDAETAGFSWVRALLWVPYCGLFASLFFPPSADDLAGLVRFAGLTAGAAAITVALAGTLARRPAGVTRLLYRRLALPFAAFTVLVAILTVSLQR